MFRSLLPISFAPLAASPVELPITPPTHEGGPRRSPQAAIRIVLALAACALFAFAGWFLLRVDTGFPGSGGAATAGQVCEPASCNAAGAAGKELLPPEWRWEGKAYRFDHMFREAPGTTRVAAFGTVQRAGERARR